MNTEDEPCHSDANKRQTKTEAVIANSNGVHTRPASAISNVACKYPDTKIIIEHDNDEADAKSVVELLGLGLKFNDKVIISASGADAEKAVADIRNVIEKKNIVLTGKTEIQNKKTEKKDISDKKTSQETTYQGTAACSLPATGKTVILQKIFFDFEEKSNLDPQEEKIILDSALKQAKILLEKDAGTETTEKNEIIKAHLSLIDDKSILSVSYDAISNGKTASAAFCEAISQAKQKIKNSPNKAINDRTADLDALSDLVLGIICGRQDRQLFPPNTILIAEHILPSSELLSDKNISGIITIFGNAASHAAIMIRSAKIPYIYGVSSDILSVKDGSFAEMNVKEGRITINAVSDSSGKTGISVGSSLPDTDNEIDLFPAITKDGTRIEVMANAGTLPEALSALDCGADGIGLLRSEFLFYGERKCPYEQVQTDIYSKIVSSLNGRPAAIRLLDAGGDKPLDFITFSDEENPALGERGIRLLDKNREIFSTQIRAILSANRTGKAKILLPMVSSPDEFVAVKEEIQYEANEIGTEIPQIGAMIETPAAAILAERIAEHADFLSIGSNDLAQYSFAMDRNGPLYSKYAAGANTVMLRLIKMAVDGAVQFNRPISICGTLAADLSAIPLLIGIGIRSFSVPLSDIGRIKKHIRGLDCEKCRKMTEQALGKKTVEGQKRENILSFLKRIIRALNRAIGK